MRSILVTVLRQNADHIQPIFVQIVEPPTGKLYEGHIPISPLQRSILAVGSAFTALANPLRGGKTDVISIIIGMALEF